MSTRGNKTALNIYVDAEQRVEINEWRDMLAEKLGVQKVNQTDSVMHAIRMALDVEGKK